MEKEALTYEDIREIQRKEKGSSKLQKISKDFYKKLFNYLNSKKKLLEKKEATEKFKRRTQRELENAKRTINNILNMREQKIALYALHSLKMKETKKFNMAPEETELFENLLKSFKQFEEDINDYEKIETEEKIEKIEVKKEEKKEKDYKVLRILEDVPEFMGEDLKKYGPAEKGDVMNLPEGVAKILINKKKAKEIEAK